MTAHLHATSPGRILQLQRPNRQVAEASRTSLSLDMPRHPTNLGPNQLAKQILQSVQNERGLLGSLF